MKKYLPEFIALTVVLLLAVGSYTCDPFTGICLGQVMAQVETLRTLSPAEFNQALTTGDYKLIDIRTAGEYYEYHLAGADQSDYYQSIIFNSYLDSLDKNGKYLIYCRTGNRTGETLKIMKQKGFKNVAELGGGINAWTSMGYPVEK
jgi:rhodanese-related sulfurtransferase